MTIEAKAGHVVVLAIVVFADVVDDGCDCCMFFVYICMYITESGVVLFVVNGGDWIH